MNPKIWTWLILVTICASFVMFFVLFFDFLKFSKLDHYTNVNNSLMIREDTSAMSRKEILKYMKVRATESLVKLSLDALSIRRLGISHVANRYPIIVTAASANHFTESLALLVNLNCSIRRMFPKMELIYFDIGLLPQQREEIKRYCNCTFVKFPFHHFPEHVYNVKIYAWKPIIIQLALVNHQFVLYVDASIRFHRYSELSTLFEKAISNGILFPLLERRFTVAHNTDVETFVFLHKNPMDYLKKYEMPTGWIFITRTEFILTNIMSPWITCALTPGCFATENAKFLEQSCRSSLQLHFREKVKVIGMCHRYEQSIISILIHDIFKQRAKFLTFNTRKYGGVYRSDVIASMRDERKTFELCFRR